MFNVSQFTLCLVPGAKTMQNINEMEKKILWTTELQYKLNWE